MGKLNKKGQNAGLVTGLVLGVVALVIGVIIAFVITSTLSSADLLSGSRDTLSVTNESRPTYIAFVNQTGYTLAKVNATTSNYAIVTIFNATTAGKGLYNYTIASANYTLSSSGVLTNATTYTYPNVSISYTYQDQSNEEKATSHITANFTRGINNISSKVPTVLLISAIVLILGVLAVLIGVWQKMRMGGGSI